MCVGRSDGLRRSSVGRSVAERHSVGGRAPREQGEICSENKEKRRRGRSMEDEETQVLLLRSLRRQCSVATRVQLSPSADKSEFMGRINCRGSSLDGLTFVEEAEVNFPLGNRHRKTPMIQLFRASRFPPKSRVYNL